MVGRVLPNLGLKAFYASGEDGWGADLSLGLLKLSVLVQGGVISKVNADPGAPADGDVYLFSGTHPTNANKIAIRDAGAWVYVVPLEGWGVYNRSANYWEIFDGANWAQENDDLPADAYGAGWNGSLKAATKDAVYDKIETLIAAIPGTYTDEQARDVIAAMILAGNGLDVTYNDGADTFTIDVDVTEIEPTDSDMWTGTNSTKAVTPKKIFDAAVTQTLTDGATINWDGNAGLNFKVTIAGNRTLANPTNMKTGQSGLIIVTQDATGSRTLAYGSNFRFPGGAAANVLSTGANAIDVISYYVRSDGTLLCTLSKAFSA